MPRRTTPQCPPLTEARVRQFDVIIGRQTADLDAKSRGRIATRKLRRLDRRAKKKRQFIEGAWAKYDEHCRERGETVGDWDSFIVWLKDFWAKYGDIIIQIAIGLIFMFLGDEPEAKAAPRNRTSAATKRWAEKFDPDKPKAKRKR